MHAFPCPVCPPCNISLPELQILPCKQAPLGKEPLPYSERSQEPQQMGIVRGHYFLFPERLFAASVIDRFVSHKEIKRNSAWATHRSESWRQSQHNHQQSLWRNQDSSC